MRPAPAIPVLFLAAALAGAQSPAVRTSPGAPSASPTAAPAKPAPAPAPTPPVPPVSPPTRLPEEVWEARLAALTPDDPRGYFELGEEVADTATTVREVSLARTLYVLTFELDRAAQNKQRLAGPACVALAALPGMSRERSWLLAMAGTVDRRYAMLASGESGADPERSLSPQTALDASTLLGYYRAGYSSAAERLLEKPEVRHALDVYERMLRPFGVRGEVDRIERELALWPCRECRNERFVRYGNSTPPEYRRCPACKGHPGPTLSTDEVVAQLRFESRVLRGIHTSWAAQLVVDENAPLRDPDPQELAPTFDVDPAKCVWRKGAWTAKPASETKVD